MNDLEKFARKAAYMDRDLPVKIWDIQQQECFHPMEISESDRKGLSDVMNSPGPSPQYTELMDKARYPGFTLLGRQWIVNGPPDETYGS